MMTYVIVREGRQKFLVASARAIRAADEIVPGLRNHARRNCRRSLRCNACGAKQASPQYRKDHPQKLETKLNVRRTGFDSIGVGVF